MPLTPLRLQKLLFLAIETCVFIAFAVLLVQFLGRKQWTLAGVAAGMSVYIFVRVAFTLRALAREGSSVAGHEESSDEVRH